MVSAASDLHILFIASVGGVASGLLPGDGGGPPLRGPLKRGS
jgi:hypothetical protein